MEHLFHLVERGVHLLLGHVHVGHDFLMLSLVFLRQHCLILTVLHDYGLTIVVEHNHIELGPVAVGSTFPFPLLEKYLFLQLLVVFFRLPSILTLSNFFLDLLFVDFL